MAGVAAVVPKVVVLLDRLDRERQGARRDADRHPVALLVADERAPDRGIDRDASGRRVALHRADQVIGLAPAFVVDDLDRRAWADDARVRFLADLGPPDHLLQLVDAPVAKPEFLFRLLVL